MKKLVINKDKNIGQVVFIVEGASTEFYILHKIFTRIFDYQYEAIKRNKPYKKYNSKVNPLSRVIVINTEESNIKFIDKDNDYLNNLFEELIDSYKVDINNAAIYYVFDRDVHSNTDSKFVEDLICKLRNSRENDNYYMQGLLLLSYPAIESFTLSNFDDNSYEKEFGTGDELKHYLHEQKMFQGRINEESIIRSVEQFELAMKEFGIESYDVDDFFETNMSVFECQEKFYSQQGRYKVLSLLCVAFLDLQLIEFERN